MCYRDISLCIRVKSLLNKAVIGLIKFYKIFFSPLLGANCRFTPTCSSYAILAFQKYGFFKAIALVGMRLLKCHPFHPGGYDPV
ncbi:MAG: membrane protein insertion efficiency factor YidD [Pseudomonadota bacterium]